MVLEHDQEVGGAVAGVGGGKAEGKQLSLSPYFYLLTTNITTRDNCMMV